MFKQGKRTKDGYLVVEAQLRALGNQAPYFSVTGELWDSEGWYRNGQDGRMRACGCLHDEILAAFPKLAPVVALHLSDENGVPMHALANSRYFAEQGEIDNAARTLRVDPSEVPQGVSEDDFAAFVVAQRPRWKREADEARALINA